MNKKTTTADASSSEQRQALWGGVGATRRADSWGGTWGECWRGEGAGKGGVA